jgi:hypothetical protein
MCHRLHQIVATLCALSLAVAILLATALPAVACDCVGPQPMAAYAGDADQVIFTGVVEPPRGGGVPVEVTRWFQGSDRDPFVRLAGGYFGADGASCGTPLPPARTEWIFVAYRSEESPDLVVSLCAPHASTDSAEGRAMLADAIATFGQGLVMGPASAPPSNVAGEVAAGDPLPLAIAAGSVVGIVVVAFGFAVIALRRRREPPIDDPNGS